MDEKLFSQVKSHFNVKLKSFFSCFVKNNPVPIKEALNFGVHFHIQVHGFFPAKVTDLSHLMSKNFKVLSSGYWKRKQWYKKSSGNFLDRIDWHSAAKNQNLWGTFKEALTIIAYFWRPGTRLIQANFQKLHSFWHTFSMVYADEIGYYLHRFDIKCLDFFGGINWICTFLK